MREALTELVGIPADAPHLAQALTHSSYANERPGLADNQRLEFLGDAVLGFCVSELLYQRYPDVDEGALTRLRAQVVNADALADFARKHGLSEDLLLGRGAASSGLESSTNVLADAVEALIAAAFLDAGLEVARSLCHRIVEPALEQAAVSERDPKSELQEWVQARRAVAPVYDLLESGGPDHARWFVVSVRVEEQVLAQGRGRSKRQAEFAAARAALDDDSWRAEFLKSASPEES